MPLPGSDVDSGAYPNQPPSGAPPRKKLEYKKTPPSAKHQ
jgi:hypothetical protein